MVITTPKPNPLAATSVATKIGLFPSLNSVKYMQIKVHIMYKRMKI